MRLNALRVSPAHAPALHVRDFLEGFPTVTRERAIAFFEEANNRVIEAAS
jgi:hypothetical protein